MNEKIYQTVLSELANLNIAMPIQVDDEVLQEKAIIFAKHLGNWSTKTIRVAFADHLRVSRFMPTPADIIEKCAAASKSIEYQRQRRMDKKSLPMPDKLPKDQADFNKQAIKRFRDKVFNRI